ncbi:MAG: hypothetical protein AB8G11_23390 [Saprospiraceae bacterium]
MEKIYTRVFRLVDIKKEENVLTLVVDIEPEINTFFENTFIAFDAHTNNEGLLDIFKSKTSNQCEINQNKIFDSLKNPVE